MTNREKFLHDVIPFIFNSRDPKMVLSNSLISFKNYMDVDFIDFSYHVNGEDNVHRICTVDNNAVFSNSYMKFIETDMEFIQNDEVFILDEKFRYCPEKLPTVCSLEGNSCIGLKIKISDNIYGCISVKVYKENSYNVYHKELLKGLAIPFSFAFSNFVMNRKLVFCDSRKLQTAAHKDLSKPKCGIIGAETGLAKVIEQACYVARYSSTVCLTGETGVGKDVFANFIHKNSPRKDGAFIKLNCGAIPDNLIDNELFGHEKGAFTGADSTSKGRFELADKGTLFLDEIGELPLNSQTRLLRVLQFGEIERLGGSKTIDVDVRIIAATNRNLKQLVAEGKFREDLFWRLNVFPINIPPLRDRAGDIPHLVKYLITKTCERLGIRQVPRVSETVMQKLMAYQWPGNVRELENTIEREIILSSSDELEFQCINIKLSSELTEDETDQDSGLLDEAMKKHILRTLAQTNWRISGNKGAAYILGVHPNTLRHRMKKLGIL